MTEEGPKLDIRKIQPQDAERVAYELSPGRAYLFFFNFTGNIPDRELTAFRQQMRAELRKLDVRNIACVVNCESATLAVFRLDATDGASVLGTSVPRREGIRGVDYACEWCGKLDGSTVDGRGFQRCNACGEPGQ